MIKTVLGLVLLSGLCGGLGGCAYVLAAVESSGYYSGPSGKEPRAEFTRLYVYNQCYETVSVAFPNEKGERVHRLRDRGIGSFWTGRKGALPYTVISKKGTPDLVFTPGRLREEARRDEWRMATGLVESYYLTLCPREPALHDDEGNQVRRAGAGEMVEEFVLHTPGYENEPINIGLNGKLVRYVESVNEQASFLLPAGSKGTLSIHSRLFDEAESNYIIGENWKPRPARPARAGELIVIEPQPVTPRGAWE